MSFSSSFSSYSSNSTSSFSSHSGKSELIDEDISYLPSIRGNRTQSHHEREENGRRRVSLTFDGMGSRDADDWLPNFAFDAEPAIQPPWPFELLLGSHGNSTTTSAIAVASSAPSTSATIPSSLFAPSFFAIRSSLPSHSATPLSFHDLLRVYYGVSRQFPATPSPQFDKHQFIHSFQTFFERRLMHSTTTESFLFLSVRFLMSFLDCRQNDERTTFVRDFPLTEEKILVTENFLCADRIFPDARWWNGLYDARDEKSLSFLKWWMEKFDSRLHSLRLEGLKFPPYQRAFWQILWKRQRDEAEKMSTGDVENEEKKNEREIETKMANGRLSTNELLLFSDLDDFTISDGEYTFLVVYRLLKKLLNAFRIFDSSTSPLQPHRPSHLHCASNRLAVSFLFDLFPKLLALLQSFHYQLASSSSSQSSASSSPSAFFQLLCRRLLRDFHKDGEQFFQRLLRNFYPNRIVCLPCLEEVIRLSSDFVHSSSYSSLSALPAKISLCIQNSLSFCSEPANLHHAFFQHGGLSKSFPSEFIRLMQKLLTYSRSTSTSIALSTGFSIHAHIFLLFRSIFVLLWRVERINEKQPTEISSRVTEQLKECYSFLQLHWSSLARNKNEEGDDGNAQTPVESTMLRTFEEHFQQTSLLSSSMAFSEQEERIQIDLLFLFFLFSHSQQSSLRLHFRFFHVFHQLCQQQKTQQRQLQQTMHMLFTSAFFQERRQLLDIFLQYAFQLVSCALTDAEAGASVAAAGDELSESDTGLESLNALKRKSVEETAIIEVKKSPEMSVFRMTPAEFFARTSRRMSGITAQYNAVDHDGKHTVQAFDIRDLRHFFLSHYFLFFHERLFNPEQFFQRYFFDCVESRSAGEARRFQYFLIHSSGLHLLFPRYSSFGSIARSSSLISDKAVFQAFAKHFFGSFLPKASAKHSAASADLLVLFDEVLHPFIVFPASIPSFFSGFQSFLHSKLCFAHERKESVGFFLDCWTLSVVFSSLHPPAFTDHSQQIFAYLCKEFLQNPNFLLKTLNAAERQQLFSRACRNLNATNALPMWRETERFFGTTDNRNSQKSMKDGQRKKVLTLMTPNSIQIFFDCGLAVLRRCVTALSNPPNDLANGASAESMHWIDDEEVLCHIPPSAGGSSSSSSITAALFSSDVAAALQFLWSLSAQSSSLSATSIDSFHQLLVVLLRLFVCTDDGSERSRQQFLTAISKRKAAMGNISSQLSSLMSFFIVVLFNADATDSTSLLSMLPIAPFSSVKQAQSFWQFRVFELFALFHSAAPPHQSRKELFFVNEIACVELLSRFSQQIHAMKSAENQELLHFHVSRNLADPKLPIQFNIFGTQSPWEDQKLNSKEIKRVTRSTNSGFGTAIRKENDEEKAAEDEIFKRHKEMKCAKRLSEHPSPFFSLHSMAIFLQFIQHYFLQPRSMTTSSDSSPWIQRHRDPESDWFVQMLALHVRVLSELIAFAPCYDPKTADRLRMEAEEREQLQRPGKRRRTKAGSKSTKKHRKAVDEDEEVLLDEFDLHNDSNDESETDQKENDMGIDGPGEELVEDSASTKGGEEAATDFTPPHSMLFIAMTPFAPLAPLPSYLDSSFAASFFGFLQQFGPATLSRAAVPLPFIVTHFPVFYFGFCAADAAERTRKDSSFPVHARAQFEELVETIRNAALENTATLWRGLSDAGAHPENVEWPDSTAFDALRESSAPAVTPLPNNAWRQLQEHARQFRCEYFGEEEPLEIFPPQQLLRRFLCEYLAVYLHSRPQRDEDVVLRLLKFITDLDDDTNCTVGITSAALVQKFSLQSMFTSRPISPIVQQFSFLSIFQKFLFKSLYSGYFFRYPLSNLFPLSKNFRRLPPIFLQFHSSFQLRASFHPAFSALLVAFDQCPFSHESLNHTFTAFFAAILSHSNLRESSSPSPFPSSMLFNVFFFTFHLMCRIHFFCAMRLSPSRYLAHHFPAHQRENEEYEEQHKRNEIYHRIATENDGDKKQSMVEEFAEQTRMEKDKRIWKKERFQSEERYALFPFMRQRTITAKLANGVAKMDDEKEEGTQLYFHLPLAFAYRKFYYQLLFQGVAALITLGNTAAGDHSLKRDDEKQGTASSKARALENKNNREQLRRAFGHLIRKNPDSTIFRCNCCQSPPSLVESTESVEFPSNLTVDAPLLLCAIVLAFLTHVFHNRAVWPRESESTPPRALLQNFLARIQELIRLFRRIIQNTTATQVPPVSRSDSSFQRFSVFTLLLCMLLCLVRDVRNARMNEIGSYEQADEVGENIEESNAVDAKKITTEKGKKQLKKRKAKPSTAKIANGIRKNAKRTEAKAFEPTQAFHDSLHGLSNDLRGFLVFLLPLWEPHSDAAVAATSARTKTASKSACVCFCHQPPSPTAPASTLSSILVCRLLSHSLCIFPDLLDATTDVGSDRVSQARGDIRRKRSAVLRFSNAEVDQMRQFDQQFSEEENEDGAAEADYADEDWDWIVGDNEPIDEDEHGQGSTMRELNDNMEVSGDQSGDSSDSEVRNDDVKDSHRDSANSPPVRAARPTRAAAAAARWMTRAQSMDLSDDEVEEQTNQEQDEVVAEESEEERG